MNETKPSETKPKKMVRRNVAVALGIMFIVVVAGLAGVFAYYLNDRNNTISSLNNQISNQNSTISSLNSQISQLNANATNLQNQLISQNSTINQLTSNLTNLQKIANLEESILVYNDSFVYNIGPSSFEYIVFYNTVAEDSLGIPLVPNPISINYAGYVAVNITSSTSNSTSVELNYTSNGFSFDNTVTVGLGGQAYFPIRPTNSLVITIANTDKSHIDIQRVIITYYY